MGGVGTTLDLGRRGAMRNILYDGVDRLERLLHTIKGWIDPGRAHYERAVRKTRASISSIPDWP
jgi:hypothetical protein